MERRAEASRARVALTVPAPNPMLRGSVRTEGAMELFGGERGAGTDKPAGPATKVERALDEAIKARNEGRPEAAIELAQTAMAWLDAGSVRRELRVGLPRELGFAHLLLGQAHKAREALLLALEQAAHDPVLSDPVRAGLATCELMAGAPERARQMLEGRGRNRRGALSALARIHLYDGNVQAAEQALQEADQAPGGTTASGILLPPATVMRCFAAVWGGRPEQARMLYDGVSVRDNPMWELVRMALLRALWVQHGDARYLALAVGTAEQLRFGEAASEGGVGASGATGQSGAAGTGGASGAPGFLPAVAAMHAAVLALSGETAMAVEAADQALGLIARADQAPGGALILPEWPRPAILCDLAMVYRDAGEAERRAKVLALWDPVAWASWEERMALVAGARVRGATTPDAAPVIDDGRSGDFEALAIHLLEDPRSARLMALRAIGARARALGLEWLDGEGGSLGRIGAKATRDDETDRIVLQGGENLCFFKADRDALREIDRGALEALARVVRVREGEARRIGELDNALVTAEAARKLAEERLEQVRRPGTDRGHGGRFPTVVGRSDRLRAVLDRLGALASLSGHVVFDGPAGSGRRHLAQALYLANSEDPTGSSRAPALDVGLVPEEAQLATLEGLEARAIAGRGGMAVVIGAERLMAAAATWLCERMAAPSPGGLRWALTLDARDQGPVAGTLRERAIVVKVPGLDERLEDLPLLVDHFAREVGKRPDDVSTAARAVLARRAWPGQVAELRTAIRQAAARAGHGLIQPEHLERGQAQRVEGPFQGEDPLALGLREAVRTLQKDLVQRGLEATAGNMVRAADLLGIPKSQLERLARELDVGLEAGAEGVRDPGE